MRKRGIVAGWVMAVAATGCNFGSTSTTVAETAGSSAGGGTSVTQDPHSQEGTTTTAPTVTIKASPGCYAASTPRRLTRTQFIKVLSDTSRMLLNGDGAVAEV